MHLGNFLKSEAEKQRLSTSEIGKMVNKTPQAVRKDFEKTELHMSVLEAFGKALKINIYDVLAQEWRAKGYEEKEEEPEAKSFSDQEPPEYRPIPSEKVESVSVTFQIPESKKEKLIKLLMS